MEIVERIKKINSQTLNKDDQSKNETVKEKDEKPVDEAFGYREVIERSSQSIQREDKGQRKRSDRD